MIEADNLCVLPAALGPALRAAVFFFSLDFLLFPIIDHDSCWFLAVVYFTSLKCLNNGILHDGIRPVSAEILSAKRVDLFQ